MLTNVSANVTFYKKALRMEGPVTFNDIAMKAVYELFLGILNEKSSGKSLNINGSHRRLFLLTMHSHYALSLRDGYPRVWEKLNQGKWQRHLCI